MLARTSIRTRLVALLVVPAAILVVVAGLRLTDTLGVVTRTADIEALTRTAQAERDLVHSLQVERTQSSAAVAGWAQGEATRGETDALLAAREQVESARATVVGAVGSLDLEATAPAVLAAHTAAQDRLVALEPFHFNLADGRVDARAIIGTFEDPVAALLDVDLAIIHAIDEPTVVDRLRVSNAISRLKDAAFRTGDVTLLLAADAIDEQTADELLTVAEAEIEAWTEVAGALITDDEQAELTAVLAQTPTTEELGDLTDDDDRSLADMTTANAEALRNLEVRYARSAVDEAATVRTDAIAAAASMGSLALVVVALVGLVLLVLRRKVLVPLRRLTGVADAVRVSLGETVDAIARGQQPAVSAFDDAAATTLTTRPDELGELARAMQAATDEATRVAAGQASTRAGITRTIEDVARREQALVERQLSLLDHLEDREEDPDQLAQLFRLDHLATRMRRNAENLLLLSSGRLPGSAETTSVPLVDVVRTAAAEIEQYARVDVRVGLHDAILGYAATPLSHLLAELIENATQFSPPTTRVMVNARRVEDGVLVKIADRGLGMAEADIVDARRRLSEPPLLEAAESRRLGLYVVGLLASSLGITVDLQPGEGGQGLVVDVQVPSALFEGHSTPNVAPLPAAPPDAPPPDAATSPESAHVSSSLPARPGGPTTDGPDGTRRVSASQRPLEDSADALAVLGQLLDAEMTTPPDLPDDVAPAPMDELPSRGADPDASAQDAGTGFSFSSASGGRTVDLDPLAISALMSGLSGDDAETGDETRRAATPMDEITALGAHSPPPGGGPPAEVTPQDAATEHPGAAPASPRADLDPPPPTGFTPSPRPRPGTGSGWSTPFPTNRSPR